MMQKGQLVVVGTGIITPQHITQEAKNHIQNADRVYHIVPDPLGIDYLKSLNPNLVYLGDCYQLTDNRRDTYTMMVERIIQGVREGLDVVAVFYGHPGVFVTPSHEAISLAKSEGYRAIMLPGISAEDCLVADLGFDPLSSGCQTFEATHFLIYPLPIDPRSACIIWQLGVVGDLTFSTNIKPGKNGINALKDKLLRYYSPDQRMAIYEAAVIPTFSPRIEWFALKELESIKINDISTLFIEANAGLEIDNEFVTKWNLTTPERGASHV